MADYKVTDSELTNIANAIRAKGGTSAPLEFPDEFVSAIQAMSNSSGIQRPYLCADISTKPCIDTGVPCNTENLKVVTTFRIGRTVNERGIFGGTWTYNGFLLIIYNNTLRFNSKSNPALDIPLSEFYSTNGLFDDITVECTKDYIKVNGNEHQMTGRGINTSDNLKIFSISNSYYAAEIAFSSFKIYQDNVLLRDFIPALTDNDVACFYDNITKQYFYNSGADELYYRTSAVDAIIEPLNITENGTYEPPSGVDGYAPVTVNVGGSVDDWTDLKNYIESNGTQYINTGYSVKDNSKFEVIANPSTAQPTYGTIFGTRLLASDSPKAYSCILATTWASQLGNVNWGSNINRLTNVDKGNKTKYFIQKSRGIALESESLEGVIGCTVTGSTQSATTADLMLFALGQNGSDYGRETHCNMKLYRFRIYEGDTLVHEYLPWQENGVACLKDTITGTLLYNAGTGDFVYGTDT